MVSFENLVDFTAAVVWFLGLPLRGGPERCAFWMGGKTVFGAEIARIWTLLLYF